MFSKDGTHVVYNVTHTGINTSTRKPWAAPILTHQALFAVRGVLFYLWECFKSPFWKTWRRWDDFCFLSVSNSLFLLCAACVPWQEDCDLKWTRLVITQFKIYTYIFRAPKGTTMLHNTYFKYTLLITLNIHLNRSV